MDEKAKQEFKDSLDTDRYFIFRSVAAGGTDNPVWACKLKGPYEWRSVIDGEFDFVEESDIQWGLEHGLLVRVTSDIPFIEDIVTTAPEWNRTLPAFMDIAFKWIAENAGAHGTHCCMTHGCKYGDRYCPVAEGLHTGIRCEDCGEAEAELERFTSLELEAELERRKAESQA